ncbi:protease modulator HflC [Neoehrlichia mikurensis]|uniref:Protein HflC n=1 Tax=Neoehrlichia mikurensis TaxID=89586 RepID=A0A9Q9BTC7_9RICK|nr:protease modulator HflC [Neoehrlichia mikurensis]QXK91645.1 protease modulator HflC [Neoehrlichia mikurensis]QXK92856.1 protease modulator HflC [Neoehrlichia mikurensis]QXK93336.1 protease modulator HflC [Neoehrlichia mikurensis]UTO55722.1 protease modulator HflC [Neoehrlichia mikurensis]UTO56639.1 protease modulator HflC [Neoehrlichia mikurensis]
MNGSLKIWLSVLAFFTVVLLYNSIFIVNEAQQAIVLQFGKIVQKIHNSGLYVKIPIIDKVIYIDNRVIDIRSNSCEVIAADQKRFIVDFYAKYKIIDPVKFYQTVRTEIGLENRLSSIIEANLREKVGSVALINFLNEARSDVMSLIQQGVSKESQKFGIEMIDVRIKRADLPEENSSAIFRRMQTDREKEAKEIRAEGEEISQKIKSDAELQKRIVIANAIKEAQIIRGEGEAKASKIYNNALKADPEFFSFYRTMQAYKKTFSNDKTKFILSPNNDFMGPFNKNRG